MSEISQAALDQLWNEYLDRTRERLALVQSAFDALEAGTLNTAAAAEAAMAAHKLAGTLGSFGLHEGTEAARTIDEILSHFPGSNPDRTAEFREELAILTREIGRKG